MDVENFFEDLSEKNWVNNISSEAEHLFDQLIEDLKDAKEDVISSTIKDIDILKEMSLEENKEFTYKIFKKWLRHCLKENIYNRIVEE